MKYKYLEYLRALAAMAVFINHIVSKIPYLKEHKSVLLQSIAAWGTEGVIIFFLLSGVVINHTSKKYSQSRVTFLKKRAIRIMPIYYTCFFLAISVDFVTNYQLNTISNYIGSLLFVATFQGLLTSPIATFGVIWSLSFEAFFYVTFALTIGKNQTKLLQYWIAVAILSGVLYYVTIKSTFISYLVLMFAYSLIWLCGYFIYEYKDRINTNFVTAVFGFSMIPLINRLQISPVYYDIVTYVITALVCVPIFILALKNGQISHDKSYINLNFWHYLPVYLLAAFLSLTYSKSLLISRIVYLSFPLFSLFLNNNKVEVFLKQIIKRCEKVMLFLASISYALYLVHVPVILLFVRLMPSSLWLNIFLILVTCFLVSYFLEHIFQKKVNKYFKKIA